MTKTDEMEIFLKNVAYLRKREELSLSAMAAEMRITVKTLRNIEKSEEPRRMKSEIWSHIIEEFGITFPELFKPIYCAGKEKDE